MIEPGMVRGSKKLFARKESDGVVVLKIKADLGFGSVCDDDNKR